MSYHHRKIGLDIKWKGVKTHHNKFTPHHSKSSVLDQELATVSACVTTTKVGPKSMKIQVKVSFATNEDLL